VSWRKDKKRKTQATVSLDFTSLNLDVIKLYSVSLNMCLYPRHKKLREGDYSFKQWKKSTFGFANGSLIAGIVFLGSKQNYHYHGKNIKQGSRSINLF